MPSTCYTFFDRSHLLWGHTAEACGYHRETYWSDVSCASIMSSRTAAMMSCIFITAAVASSRPCLSSSARLLTCRVELVS